MSIPLTKKIQTYLRNNRIAFSHDEWELFSVKGVQLEQHSSCCSELDVSDYGRRLSDDFVETLLEILSLYPDSCKYIRLTTRVSNKDKDYNDPPKGFTKLATVVSGHGPSYGYVHFFHMIIGEQI